MNKFSFKIEHALPVEMSTDSAMKSTDSRRSFMTSLLTFPAFLADRTNGRAIGTVLRMSVCRRRRL